MMPNSRENFGTKHAEATGLAAGARGSASCPRARLHYPSPKHTWPLVYQFPVLDTADMCAANIDFKASRRQVWLEFGHWAQHQVLWFFLCSLGRRPQRKKIRFQYFEHTPAGIPGNPVSPGRGYTRDPVFTVAPRMPRAPGDLSRADP